jgi:hypothetical protein
LKNIKKSLEAYKRILYKTNFKELWHIILMSKLIILLSIEMMFLYKKLYLLIQ